MDILISADFCTGAEMSQCTMEWRAIYLQGLRWRWRSGFSTGCDSHSEDLMAQHSLLIVIGIYTSHPKQ